MRTHACLINEGFKKGNLALRAKKKEVAILHPLCTPLLDSTVVFKGIRRAPVKGYSGNLVLQFFKVWEDSQETLWKKKKEIQRSRAQDILTFNL